MKQLPKLTGEGAGFEWRVLLSRAAMGLLGAFCYPHVLEASDDLLDAHTVLSEVKQVTPTAAPTSEAGQLVADISRFRTASTTLSPKESTAAWFGLLDRALNLGPQSYLTSVYDTDLKVPVGVQSVIGALPAPAAWPALREQAHQRTIQSGADYRTLSVELLAAVLLGDRAATDVDLKAIDTALATVAPETRAALQSNLTRIRNTLTKLYGNPSEIARAFSTQVAVAARTGRAPKVEVPDLVTLVGEPEAAKILTNALSQPVTLEVGSGDATRALARRIALENVEALKAAQWALVDSVDAAPLYEALQRRFAGTLSAPTSETQPALSFDSAKRTPTPTTCCSCSSTVDSQRRRNLWSRSPAPIRWRSQSAPLWRCRGHSKMTSCTHSSEAFCAITPSCRPGTSTSSKLPIPVIAPKRSLRSTAS